MDHDRRTRRSNSIHEALGFQMQACHEDAGLEAMILSDTEGMCMAAAGAPDTCEEVAAALPLLGRTAADFADALLAKWGTARVTMQRFRVDQAELYVAAVGDDENLRARQVARSIGGVTRILALA